MAKTNTVERNQFIGETADETLRRCAAIADFIGEAVDGIDHGGGVVNAAAVTWIMNNLREALNYEKERVSTKRGVNTVAPPVLVPISRAKEAAIVKRVRTAIAEQRRNARTASGL